MDKKFNFNNSSQYNDLPDKSSTGLSKEDVIGSGDSISDIMQNIQRNQIQSLLNSDESSGGSSGSTNGIKKFVYRGTYTLYSGELLDPGVEKTVTMNFVTEEFADELISRLSLIDSTYADAIGILRAYGSYNTDTSQPIVDDLVCLYDVTIVPTKEKVVGSQPRVYNCVNFKLNASKACRVKHVVLYVLF